MQRNLQELSVNRVLAFVLLLISLLVLERGLIANVKWYWLLVLTVPGLLVCLMRRR